MNNLTQRRKIGFDRDETILRLMSQSDLLAELEWFPTRFDHQSYAGICYMQDTELA